MQGIELIFALAILMMSVVAHEVAHGYAANALGDPTARHAGRLTANPLKHLDLIGSVRVPIFTFISGGIIFGWAKPVPFNPYNLRGGKWGPALVALAGPSANLVIAIVFGLILRFGWAEAYLGITSALLIAEITMTNIVLAIFNLIPVPPFDGSKVLFAVIPYQYSKIEDWMLRYELVIFFLVVIYFWRFIAPLIPAVFNLIVG